MSSSVISAAIGPAPVIPKLPHCMQCPDLDGVIQKVSEIAKKTPNEIREMINASKITLTGKVIKEIFREMDTGSVWGYNTTYFGKNKEGMQKGLLSILTGTHTPSVAIRGDCWVVYVQKKKEAEEALEIYNQQFGQSQSQLTVAVAEIKPVATSGSSTAAPADTITKTKVGQKRALVEEEEEVTSAVEKQKLARV